MNRLTQEDILEGVFLLLQERGEIPKGKVYFERRFGIEGDPDIFFNAGTKPAGEMRVYIDWSATPVDDDKDPFTIE